MIAGALTTAFGALRRLLQPVPLLLAAGAGALVGLLVRGMPEPELAARAFPVLATLLGALVALPLSAGWICSERQHGYEQLVAVRKLSSLSWTAGRLGGSLVGAGALLMLLFAVARVVGGTVEVPQLVEGIRPDGGSAAQTASGAFDGDATTLTSEGLDLGPSHGPDRATAKADGSVEWRFSLPADHPGPYELQLDTLVSRVSKRSLSIDLMRGGVALALGERPISGRRVRLTLPDLAPARGDLYVTLHPGPGLVLDGTAPRLAVGRVPLGRAGLPPPFEWVTRLLVALLAGVAAACAFRFETACLAALLALAVDPAGHPVTLVATLVFLFSFATLGTALARRTAMP